MAGQIRADRDPGGNGKAAAKKKADELFAQKGKAPAAAPPPKVVEAKATPEDMQRMFTLVKTAEATYEKHLADIREQKTGAKAIRDKAISDAADAMKTRGITKRMFTELVAMSKRKSDETVAEIKNWVWAVRAIGLPVGTQLAFFDESFAGEDEALRKAYVAGRDAHTEGKGDADNPFHPSSRPGQEWLRGLADAQADTVNGMKPKAH